MIVPAAHHRVRLSGGSHLCVPAVYGRTYWGAQRATFLVDEEGVVRHVIPKASPKTHDDEVLAALAGLQPA